MLQNRARNDVPWTPPALTIITPPVGKPIIGICGDKILGANSPALHEEQLIKGTTACCGAGAIQSFVGNSPAWLKWFENSAEKKAGLTFQEYVGAAEVRNTISKRNDNVIVALIQSAFERLRSAGIVYAADRYYPKYPEQSGQLGFLVEEIAEIRSRSDEPWIHEFTDEYGDSYVWEMFIQCTEPVPNPCYNSDPEAIRLIGLMASCKKWPKEIYGKRGA